MLEYNLSAGILPLRKSFSKSNGSIITIDTPYNHSNFIKTYTLTQLYESEPPVKRVVCSRAISP